MPYRTLLQKVCMIYRRRVNREEMIEGLSPVSCTISLFDCTFKISFAALQINTRGFIVLLITSLIGFICNINYIAIYLIFSRKKERNQVKASGGFSLPLTPVSSQSLPVSQGSATSPPSLTSFVDVELIAVKMPRDQVDHVVSDKSAHPINASNFISDRDPHEPCVLTCTGIIMMTILAVLLSTLIVVITLFSCKGKEERVHILGRVYLVCLTITSVLSPSITIWQVGIKCMSFYDTSFTTVGAALNLAYAIHMKNVNFAVPNSTSFTFGVVLILVMAYKHAAIKFKEDGGSLQQPSSSN